jgi:prophage regulatory protein
MVDVYLDTHNQISAGSLALSGNQQLRIAETGLAIRAQDADYARPMMVASPASCGSSNNLSILRLPDVMKRVGLKHASIYERMAAGSFPKQISLGARAVGWLEHEIDAWLISRISAARKWQKI